MSALLVSCLPKYYGVSPELAYYTEASLSDGRVSVVVGDSLLYSTKRTEKQGLLFIPLKVVNNTNEPFLLNSESITVFNNYEPVRVVGSKRYYKYLKKKTLWYYVIGTVVLPTYHSSSGFSFHKNTWPISVGALVYIVKAHVENKKLKKDIEKYDLLNKQIEPGSTNFGYICIEAKKRKELAIRIEE
jgi:hypothetical protein